MVSKGCVLYLRQMKQTTMTIHIDLTTSYSSPSVVPLDNISLSLIQRDTPPLNIVSKGISHFELLQRPTAQTTLQTPNIPCKNLSWPQARLIF